MKKIGVLTSGGDAPGMNAAIRAVVRCGINAGFEVWGVERGYEGLLDEDLRQMNLSSVGEILHRGGTVLKTARSERFRDPLWIDKAAEFLREREIVHYQRFGEGLQLMADKLDSKNFYAFNPSFDKHCMKNPNRRR